MKNFDTPADRNDYFSEIEELIHRIGLRENWEMPRDIWDDQWMMGETDETTQGSRISSEED